MASWNAIKWYIDSKNEDLKKQLAKTNKRLKEIEDKLERQSEYEMEMGEYNE